MEFTDEPVHPPLKISTVSSDTRIYEKVSPPRTGRKSPLRCFRCGCLGRAHRFATASGGSRVLPQRCACAQCNGASRCVFSNIDKCIVCGEHYEFDDKSFEFRCPSRCAHSSLSDYTKRFLSLSTVDINTPLPPWKRTLLHSAVAASDSSLCWDLLKRGANPFSCDYLGVSSIALAASMLPVEEDDNCAADPRFKEAIRIYQMLPKLNGDQYAYLEYLLPIKRQERGYSMGDYHGGPGGHHTSGFFGSFSPPRGSAFGMMERCGDSFKGPLGSVSASPRAGDEGPKLQAKKKHRKHRHRRRARTLHDSELKPKKMSGHHPSSFTWASVVAKSIRDPLGTMNTSASTMLPAVSPRGSSQYKNAVKFWTDAVKTEGTTHALLDRGMQPFTSLTLMRLTDTTIDTYEASPDSAERDHGVVPGDIFLLDEDAGLSSTSPRQGRPLDAGSPGRGRGYSNELLGSPRRDRSHSQASFGSPRGRTRTMSIGELTPGRARTYSQAEMGGSLSLLRHCTLKELRRAVLDNDMVHSAVSNELSQDDARDEREMYFSCSACLEYFRSSEFAFTCHRMGCGGNLCQDCLYRSLVIAVTSALYAVPMMRCPSRCRGRLPTSAWVNQLEGIEPTAEEVDSLEVTTRDTASSLLEEMRLSLNRCIEMELEVFHNPENDNSMNIDIMQRAATQFFVKAKKLLEEHGLTLKDVFVASQQVSDDSSPVPLELESESSFDLTLFGRLLFSSPCRDGLAYGSQYSWSRYKAQDKLQDLMMHINPESIVNKDPVSCMAQVKEVIVSFIVHLYVFSVEIFPQIDSALQIEESKRDTDQLLSASQLLMSRYEHNADSLLMMRCGKCDKTVSLFFAAENGHAIPLDMTDRQTALEELLRPYREEDQIVMLRSFISFSGASVSASTFISSVYCVWIKYQSKEVADECASGVLCENLRSFMCKLITLFIDIERRLAAQLALFRAYPKIWTVCCDSAHCFMCKVKGHHAGRTCEQVQNELVGADAQYCPGCGVPTLRTEGCHHILCVCGMSWQWKGGADPNDVDYDFDADGSDALDSEEDSDDSFDDDDDDDEETEEDD